MSTLTSSIASSSSSPAVIIPDDGAGLSLSYPQLLTHIHKFQSCLAGFGITPQSAVSIALPNTLAFILAFLGVSAQGATAAPLNPAYKQSEFEFYISDIEATLVLVPQGAIAANAPAVRAARRFGAGVAEIWWDSGDLLVQLIEVGKMSCVAVPVAKATPNDVALVLHTSGTTGRPKAVPLRHRNLAATMRNIVATYALTASDRSYLVMPLFHVHGLLAGLLAPLSSGGTVIVPPKFSAKTFWRDFEKHGATWYSAVPTIHQILLKTPMPTTLPKIRFVRSCSSPLSPTTLHALEKALSAPVLEAYAMTEAAHQMTSNPLPPAAHKAGTVGVAQGGVSLAIVNADGKHLSFDTEGEIAVRGENVTSGYLNNDKANAEAFTSDGYFRTGDQGRMDVDGYVTITGRIKELINRGGEKISPIEVDNAISAHPAVAEAVSFATESEMYGQGVAAAVVVKQGMKVGMGELKEFVKEKLAEFKVPTKWYFTEHMPKTATGKVQRRMVAAAMAEKEKAKAKL